MRALLLTVLGASLCAAAPAPGFPGPGEPYWLKSYSLSPVRAYWTGTLTVGDPAAELPKLLEAIKAEGGELTEPLEAFAASKDGSQRQLSWAMPQKRGAALLRRLRRLGVLPDPIERNEGAPIPLKEVTIKADALMKEEREQSAALAKVPAHAAAAREILERLLMVQELARRAEPELIFNLNLRKN